MHIGTSHPLGRLHSQHRTGRSAAATSPVALVAKLKLYNLRHPERPLFYQTIAEHFETWHALASVGQLRYFM